MSSSDSPGLPPELLDLAKQITLGRYFAGVAFTLAIYDWIITLEREIKWVWKTHWRWTKAIYFVNRFLSIVGLTITVIAWADGLRNRNDRSMDDPVIGESNCKIYFYLVGMIQWGTFFSGNTLLTLRVAALWNNRPVVTRILYTILLITWTMTGVFTAVTLHSLASQTYYSMDFHLCASTASAPLSAAIFVTPAIFELGLFIMTLTRAIKDVRSRVADSLLNPASPLLFVLYRDGFYYFLSVFAVYTWIAMAYITLEIKSTYMGVYFGWALIIVMSSRVYLNLCQAVHDRSTTMGSTAIDTSGTVTNPRTGTTARTINQRSQNTIGTVDYDNHHHIELKSQPYSAESRPSYS